jgi:hypothetical protein
MRVPANIITENKYTIGKEFINKKTHKLYQGYYYELNNKFFAGKEFNNNAPELIKIKSDQVNNLLLTAATYVFGSLSKVKLTDQKIPSFFFRYESNIRYFTAKSNTNPILIKEINKETFNQIKDDPLYLSVLLSYDGGFSDKELNEAEIKIPGIKTFVSTSYTNPPVEEGGSIG